MSVRLIKAVVCAVMVCAGAQLSAREYFVDAARPDDSGDGLSEATAFQTIQAAVTAAEADESTPRIVTVLPGTYDKGGAVDSYECDQDAYKGQVMMCTNRVHIYKSLTLRAKDPTQLTEIVGAWDTSETATDSSLGIGPAAVRCILVESSDPVYIKGFTIRDGAAHDDNTRTKGGYWPTFAGGVAYQQTNRRGFVLVDCTIRNCSGRRGGACAGGKLIRCRISKSYGNSLLDSVALHSVIYDQRAAWFGQYAMDNAKLYNCTVFKSNGNGNSAYFSQGGLICNTLVFGFSTYTYSSGTVHATNSVVQTAWVGIGQKDDASVFGVSDAYYMFKSPLDDDWRLRADSAYLTLGDAKYIAELGWAADFEPYKDLDGNTLPTTGAIAPGCTQSTFTPVCGPIYIGSNLALVDGTRPTFSGSYFYADDKFAQFKLTVNPSEGQYLHSWSALYGYWSRFPAVDNSLMVMPPMDVDTVSVNTPTFTQQALWVSPAGNDDTGDGSEANPYKTLLKVGEAANELYATSQNKNFVVFAAAGTYDERSIKVRGTLSRVYDYDMHIRYIGAGAYGENKSTILGELDETVEAETSPYGRGPNSVRCAMLANYYSCLQNFELKNGRCSMVDGDLTDSNRGGASFGGVLVDCHLVNCGAGRGQAIYDGRLERCRVTKPDPIPGGRIIEGTSACYALSCIFEDQVGRGANHGYTDGLYMLQCTAYPYSGCRGVQSGAKIFNCLTTPASAPSDSWDFGVYGLVGLCSVCNPHAGTPIPDYLYADPKFADYKNGDYRLLSTSPAIGYGSLRSPTSTSGDTGYWKTYGPDINGNKILFFDGKPLPGAVQEIVQAVNVTKPTYGTVVPEGETFIEPGESLTVTVTPGVRPYLGFVINGVFTNQLSVTIPAPATPTDTCMTVVPQVSTNWYANAAMPDDSGDGFTPATAKKTLISLCTNTYLLAGDVIHAAAGDYNEGACVHNKNYTLRSRVIAKSGVSIVGAGQDVTFISGSPAEGTEGGSTASCGPTAVRCAYGEANSVIKGFTLRNGYANSTTGVSYETLGGGFLGVSSAHLVDCTITNCFANRGALSHGGYYERCSLMGNTKAVNTAFDGNNVADFGGFYNCRVITSGNFSIVCPFVNCILRNTSANNSSGWLQIYATKDQLKNLVNCIIAGSLRNQSTTADDYFPAYSNNIVCMGFGGTTPSKTCQAYFKVLTKAQIEEAYDYATLAFKGTKSSYFCDAGVNMKTHTNETDIAGNQRIYNQIVDLGPGEYDWRGDFASALGISGVTVTAASPEVTLNANGQVRLPDGAAAAVSLANENARRVNFEIANGTLDTTGGRTGEQSFTESGSLRVKGPTDLTFSFTGADGYADLTQIGQKAGFIFLTR